MEQTVYVVCVQDLDGGTISVDVFREVQDALNIIQKRVDEMDMEGHEMVLHHREDWQVDYFCVFCDDVNVYECFLFEEVVQ